MSTLVPAAFCPDTSLPWQCGWPCTGRQWLTCFYLVETNSELHNVSTQLARFPWVLQIPCSLSGAQLENPHFAVPFSLEPSQISTRKIPHKLNSETMVTQSLGATTKTLSCKPY